LRLSVYWWYRCNLAHPDFVIYFALDKAFKMCLFDFLLYVFFHLLGIVDCSSYHH
jgi:hypothetical protein